MTIARLSAVCKLLPPLFTSQALFSTSNTNNQAMELPKLHLNDGNTVPAIGFGTGTAWYKDGGEGPFEPRLVDLLKTAMKKGFVHIDGAEAYGTEEEIGIAIKESNIPRDRLFVTSKVQDNIFDIPHAIDQTLAKLQLDYVDLYMIHWPYFGDQDLDLQKAWMQMEKVKEEGKAKSIGVSNYLRPHLETTLKVATVVPAVNQIEFHPYLQRANDFIPWMNEHGIKVEGFKPLVALTSARGGPLDQPLGDIAQAHNVTADAVLLRWQMQNRVVPITTTTKTARLDEYAAATEFVLSNSEVEKITSIGLTHHFRAWQPKRFAPDDRT